MWSISNNPKISGWIRNIDMRHRSLNLYEISRLGSTQLMSWGLNPARSFMNGEIFASVMLALHYYEIWIFSSFLFSQCVANTALIKNCWFSYYPLLRRMETNKYLTQGENDIDKVLKIFCRFWIFKKLFTFRSLVILSSGLFSEKF